MYANEVEGRTANVTGGDEDLGSKGKERAKDEKRDKASEAGWFSHPWRKIKRLIED
jgi:hypothetical protein